MSPFLNGVPQPRPMLGDFRTGAGTISLSWSCGVRVSLHKPVAESIRGSRPCKKRKERGTRLCRATLARSRATGSTPLGRPVSRHGGTESQRKNEKMKGAASGRTRPLKPKPGLSGPPAPTQTSRSESIRGSRPCKKRKDGAPACVGHAREIKSNGSVASAVRFSPRRHRVTEKKSANEGAARGPNCPHSSQNRA